MCVFIVYIYINNGANIHFIAQYSIKKGLTKNLQFIFLRYATRYKSKKEFPANAKNP